MKAHLEHHYDHTHDQNVWRLGVWDSKREEFDLYLFLEGHYPTNEAALGRAHGILEEYYTTTQWRERKPLPSPTFPVNPEWFMKVEKKQDIEENMDLEDI